MILYYTHNAKPEGFQLRCYNYHKEQAARMNQPFVSVVKEPIGAGDIVLPFDESLPKYADICVRILRGLEGVPDDELVFLCEDDTLYPDERYCNWTLSAEAVCYNLNICYLGPRGYAYHMQGGIALSQLMGTASAVRYNIELKLAEMMALEMSCIEPCSAAGKLYRSTTIRLNTPSVDFRTDYNASWALPDDIATFEDLPYWGKAKTLWNKLYEGVE